MGFEDKNPRACAEAGTAARIVLAGVRVQFHPARGESSCRGRLSARRECGAGRSGQPVDRKNRQRANTQRFQKARGRRGVETRVARRGPLAPFGTAIIRHEPTHPRSCCARLLTPGSALRGNRALDCIRCAGPIRNANREPCNAARSSLEATGPAAKACQFRTDCSELPATLPRRRLPATALPGFSEETTSKLLRLGARRGSRARVIAVARIRRAQAVVKRRAEPRALAVLQPAVVEQPRFRGRRRGIGGQQLVARGPEGRVGPADGKAICQSAVIGFRGQRGDG